MTYTDAERNLVILDSLEGLTYHIKRGLLQNFRLKSPDFQKMGEDAVKSELQGLYKKGERDFSDGAYRDKILSVLESKGVRAVTYFSADYPSALKKIPSPPIVLYCRGNTKLLTKECFSIVGSRRTAVGYMKAASLAAEEICSRFVVATGIADGADSAVLNGALPTGKAISVLAYGMDFVYPAVNERLLRKTEKEGLVITEHRPEVEPRSYLFPPRNRLIAALGRGTLVVSGGLKSGALITADYAKQYSKDLFAFPHGIGSASGEGCNKLIKEGAVLAENGGDVLEYYGTERKSPKKAPLTDSERAVLSAIAELGEAHVEAIAAKVGKKPFLIAGELTSLEIKQAIVRLGGNRYGALRTDD